MRTTTVSQLKVSLSAYLRQVKAGEELVITERGRPIARLLPLSSSTPLPEHLKAMEKRDFSSAARGLCLRSSGTCRVPRIPSLPCYRRSCASGKRVGEILGWVGCGAIVRSIFTFGRGIGDPRPEPGNGPTVALSQGMYFYSDAPSARGHPGIRRRTCRTQRVARPDPSLDRDAAQRRAAKHGRMSVRHTPAADSGCYSTGCRHLVASGTPNRTEICVVGPSLV